LKEVNIEPRKTAGTNYIKVSIEDLKIIGDKWNEPVEPVEPVNEPVNEPVTEPEPEPLTEKELFEQAKLLRKVIKVSRKVIKKDETKEPIKTFTQTDDITSNYFG
jgi:uncharacterized protein YnzC (UPF0291/DUF896 family)